MKNNKSTKLREEISDFYKVIEKYNRANPNDTFVTATVKSTSTNDNGVPVVNVLRPNSSEVLTVVNPNSIFLLPGDELFILKVKNTLTNSFTLNDKGQSVKMTTSFDSLSTNDMTVSFTSPYTDVTLNDYLYVGLVGTFMMSKVAQTDTTLVGICTGVTYTTVSGYAKATCVFNIQTAGLVDGTWTLDNAYIDNDTSIHTNVSKEISSVDEKTTLVDDDVFVIEDSAASYIKKRVPYSALASSTLVVSTTLASAVASVEFTGLDIDADGGIYEIFISGVGSTTDYVYVEYSGNASSSTYEAEADQIYGGANHPANYADARAFRMGTATFAVNLVISHGNDYPSCKTQGFYLTTGGTLVNYDYAQVYKSTVTNITSIKLLTIAGTFNIGTTVKIFKRV